MPGKDKYIDQVYHFKGKWDVPGLCGLKIIRKKEHTIVIASNLYDQNPGTSVSRWITPLANTICAAFEIVLQELVFIERNPDRKSKLAFYEETFDIVKFEIENKTLINPVWVRVSSEEVDELIS